MKWNVSCKFEMHRFGTLILEKNVIGKSIPIPHSPYEDPARITVKRLTWI